MNIFFVEIGHIGYKKNQEFYANLKNVNYLSDEMTPKKVIIKKQKNGT